MRLVQCMVRRKFQSRQCPKLIEVRKQPTLVIDNGAVAFALGKLRPLVVIASRPPHAHNPQSYYHMQKAKSWTNVASAAVPETGTEGRRRLCW
jgi:hypothetical protein